MHRRSDSADSPDCAAADCEVNGKREFLKTAAAVLAGLATLGLTPDSAAAMPMRFANALLRQGDEVRYPIPTADGVTVDRDNGVMLARTGGKIIAFSLTCPHQNTALKWLPEDGRFQCPKHKSKYQPDGTFISGRATRNMDRFAIRKDGAQVVVDLNTMYEQDKAQAGWDAASVPA